MIAVIRIVVLQCHSPLLYVFLFLFVSTELLIKVLQARTRITYYGNPVLVMLFYKRYLSQ